MNYKSKPSAKAPAKSAAKQSIMGMAKSTKSAPAKTGMKKMSVSKGMTPSKARTRGK